jgi:hypothetical protein
MWHNAVGMEWTVVERPAFFVPPFNEEQPYYNSTQNKHES